MPLSMKRYWRSHQRNAGWLVLATALIISFIVLRVTGQDTRPQFHLPPPPPVSIDGTNLIWNITNGWTNAVFYIRATTNLSQPLLSQSVSNWICVQTNSFDSQGMVRLVLPMEPDKPFRFYCLSNTNE